LWLNLPAKNKFAEPDYRMLWAEDIPEVLATDTFGITSTVRIIAGQFEGTHSLDPNASSWANDPNNHVGIFMIRMDAGATLTIPAVSATVNRNLYFYRGTDSIHIDDQRIGPSNRAKLDGNAQITLQNGTAESFLLLLEGEPIQEPVAHYGPFVMNSEAEIRQAMRDYQETEFGGWPWARHDQVHERDQDRFARYSDGRVEHRNL
jgi:redox-sensitive bicupin YhaK (pirin superfamily)